jgi:very-short-patch-repair endonuclease
VASESISLSRSRERGGVRVRGATVLARGLRQRSTDAERLVWQHLRDRRLGGLKFRRQHPVGRYIVDFVCPECRLVVELDGSQHMVNRTADAKRTRDLAQAGYRVLRFWDNDVLRNTDAVLAAILAAAGVNAADQPSPLPSPLKGEGIERRNASY